MVRVQLKDGREIEVPGGKRANFFFKTDKDIREISTEVGATLDIFDKEGYSGKFIASFLKDEVTGFVIEPEDNKEAA